MTRFHGWPWGGRLVIRSVDPSAAERDADLDEQDGLLAAEALASMSDLNARVLTTDEAEAAVALADKVTHRVATALLSNIAARAAAAPAEVDVIDGRDRVDSEAADGVARVSGRAQRMHGFDVIGYEDGDRCARGHQEVDEPAVQEGDGLGRGRPVVDGRQVPQAVDEGEGNFLGDGLGPSVVPQFVPGHGESPRVGGDGPSTAGASPVRRPAIRAVRALAASVLRWTS